MVLVLHPGIQERAQAEIDTIVGRKRLPKFEDRPRMPYIDAICRELVRWRMVTPLGMRFLCDIWVSHLTVCQLYHTRLQRTMYTRGTSFPEVSLPPCSI